MSCHGFDQCRVWRRYPKQTYNRSGFLAAFSSARTLRRQPPHYCGSLLGTARRWRATRVLSVEQREILLAGAYFRAFEPPLVVVEWHIVVRLGPCEDAPEFRVGNLEECGRGLFLAALAYLTDEALLLTD